MCALSNNAITYLLSDFIDRLSYFKTFTRQWPK